IATAKDNMKLVGELPVVAEMMQRALDLDESFDEGAIHEFFIVYESSKDGGQSRAKKHMEQALKLSKNKKVGPLVSYVESVCVQTQDKKCFDALLGKAIAFDVDSDLDHRLVNILQQRRAKWLLERKEDLFAE